MAYKQFILVCGGTACESNKGIELVAELKRAVEAVGLVNDVQVVRTGCLGFCEKGPIVKIIPEDTFYVEVKPEDATEIVNEHIVKGRMVERLLYDKSQSKQHVEVDEIDFYQKQFRIVLRNCGVIDPDKIEEYIARDGYAALEKVLFEMSPDQVIDELDKSGLRGRGGAGFPVSKKWAFAKVQQADQKYMVCNADEGDPGAYMDRSTLEGDPHSIIEAMTIAGYTIGANKGYVYIRAEYPLAIGRLELAISQAREYGLLGDNILGTDFSFDIEIRLGAGAFVCGEETALLASIEGKRGMPTPRPPFPAVKGLWGKPTVINNVETLANIPVIITKGSDWFSKIGTATSKGTKVFALTGKVKNSGLIEVPMGTTLREIIFNIGGGIRDGRQFKAAQTGGPSGGVIPPEFLDLPIDYENLAKIGSIMGSGGLIVMDETDCIVDVAKFYLDFTVEESCGKCAPCRIGGRSLYNLLGKITAGTATMDDIDTMQEIATAMQRASLCGLGQTAPNPVVSGLRYFRDEYEKHIIDKKCPSGKCKNLLSYSIDPVKCVGCTACARVCPVNAIAGERKKTHVIDPVACIKCGQCYEVCKFGAVIRG
ncbi:MAG: NADH-quinone oxidoreductase subunit NuoF [Lentisphaerae bacterium]|jgi:NADH:ubiquinone oxidoreductase subunit F (NADH-binding)/(2Fe-2S) ferredoxin/Pyruvate/2-oxoacid:ferredoxin oxidoreductase delta subunit|nr:NADH-quinone oxidoreductase subunit NuoF [Lentisphaerota bacterium]